jgi:site-specific DNA-methyltransferase (adenine-specific)
MKLTNEDNMELMARYPDKYFDLAIVDPPYGIGLGFSDSHEQKRGGGKKGGHSQKDWNKKSPNDLYFDELLRVSKKHIIWGCNYYGHNQGKFGQGRIIHNKKVTTFIASTYSHADIAATNCQNRITMFDFQWSGNVQNGKMNTKNDNNYDSGLEKRIHPTQKPIALYKWLLTKYAKEGDKILDTHLGSGSIAIACHDLGFDLTGCELDSDYFNAMMKRLQDHKKQLKLL